MTAMAFTFEPSAEAIATTPEEFCCALKARRFDQYGAATLARIREKEAADEYLEAVRATVWCAECEGRRPEGRSTFCSTRCSRKFHKRGRPSYGLSRRGQLASFRRAFN